MHNTTMKLALLVTSLLMAGCLGSGLNAQDATSDTDSLGSQRERKYTLTYDGNGSTAGTVPTDTKSPYLEGAVVTISNTTDLSKTGNAFAGWNTKADGSGTSHAPNTTFTMPAANVVLYAQWTPVVVSDPAFTVTYDGNGYTSGALPLDSDSPYAPGESVIVLANAGAMRRTGYTFVRWNLKADGSGTSYLPGDTFTMPADDVTLFAEWTLQRYDVAYDDNTSVSGFVPNDTSAPYLAGATVTVLGNTGSLAKPGFAFTGWNTAANGTGTSYAPGASFSMPNQDVTLYAQWGALFAVTYDGNTNTSGAVPSDSSSPYVAGTVVTVLSNTGNLSKSGFVFAGWNTAANGSGSSYAPGATFTMPSFALTLYAQWATAYTLTYNGNTATGGSVPTDSSSPYAAGGTVTVLGNTSGLTRTGYSFAGWNTQANGGGSSYAPGATFSMPSGNTVLYAQWTINSYTVTYDANSATSGTAPSDSSSPYNYAATVTVLSNSGNLARTGFGFAGWNTASDGSGTTYAIAQTFTMPANNVTLYAKWNTNRTITFNANGGSGTMAQQVIASGLSATLTPNAFTNSGYSFAGWATTPSGAVTYNDGQLLLMGSTDITLYAVWASTTSLLVHYKFDAQNADDTSGNANHGVANNITYVSDGAGGYSASLNGTSSYIRLPNALLRTQSNFTMMIRFRASASQYGMLFGYQNLAVGMNAADFVPVLGIRSDGKLRGELWVGSQLEVISSGTVNDGNWHTAYFSATPGSITLYLDGVNIGTNTGTVQHLTMDYNQIGTAKAAGRTLMPNVNPVSNNWFYFTGQIDDFYFYDTAL